MKKLQKQAFTLVELIVVITILAILGTIAFISFQNYTRDARNGVRISDINNIEKILGIFITEKGFYPIPDYGTHITYSGALARTQGTVGDNVTTNLRNLSKKPTDPLTGDEYTYSIANNNVEYQVATILEGGSMVYNLPVTNQANAATTKIATSKVKGTYNEKILKVNTGGLDYVLAVPSIINSNINHVDLQDIITNKELVFNNYENLPDSYKNSGYTMTGGLFEFVPGGDIVVYSGSICMSGDTEKLRFINNLKTIYNGTLLQGDSLYSEIINVDTINNPTGAIALVDNYIRNHIGGIVCQNLPLSEIPPPLVACSLTQNQVDTLNGYVLAESLYAYDSEWGTLTPSNENEWCNNVKNIEWYGGSSIPVDIWSLSNLNELYLSRNELTSLPSDIGNLTKLTRLDLYHNSLTSLPSDIGNLTNLTNLRLSENSLADLPSEILNLTNLTVLDLDTNLLISLPSDIGNLTKLTNLILGHNSLQSLPPEIGNLTNLTVLDLNNNSLSSLPSGIGNLTNLTVLDLLSNSLQSIPSSIGNLTNLTQLNLGFNALSSIPPEIGSLINLTSLNLRNNSLSNLPVEIGSLTNLNELYLMYNSLSSLPVEIGSLTNLTRVYFDNNLLQSIPSSIGYLTNLTVLDLLHNSLITLPSTISNLTNLTELYLQYNTSLGDLSYNFYSSIPSNKSQLNIPTAGQTMTIGGNGTKIIITVTQ